MSPADKRFNELEAERSEALIHLTQMLSEFDLSQEDQIKFMQLHQHAADTISNARVAAVFVRLGRLLDQECLDVVQEEFRSGNLGITSE